MAQSLLRSTARRGALLATALGATIATGAAQAQTVASNEPGWRFNVAPYVWAPSVSGQLRYTNLDRPGGASGAKVDLSATSVLSDLNFAAMVAAEARYARFSIATDIIYLSLGNSSSAVRDVNFGANGRTAVSGNLNAGTQSSLNAGVFTVAPAYTLAHGAWGNIDAQIGFRWLGGSSTTDIRLGADLQGPARGLTLGRTGRISQDVNVMDGIVGVRGRIVLGHGFSVPFAADVGAGASRLTWQALGGLSYQTGWAGVTAGYRYLSYEQGGNALLQNVNFGGPFIALNMSF